ncbi:unnamed protein product [marine sediment metagenome]|uniref:DUF104 domain-containing protein n=1 Tax=marine sediment metagenome TaxID=412755 RepID=X0VLR4_9ZZZZ
MTYRGHVENGVVVLDEGVPLPEGVEVTVDLAEANPAEPSGHAELNAPGKDPLWGLLADDAELVDQILADVMEDRQRCMAGRMGERDGKKR